MVLSDHGQTQGATSKQWNGFGLDELVRRSLAHGNVGSMAGGDEQDSMVGARRERGDGPKEKAEESKKDVSGEDVVVMGPGNLGPSTRRRRSGG